MELLKFIVLIILEINDLFKNEYFLLKKKVFYQNLIFLEPVRIGFLNRFMVNWFLKMAEI